MIPFEREPKRDRGREPRDNSPRSDRLRAGRGEVDRRLRESEAPQLAESGLSSGSAGWLVGPLILGSIAAAMLFVFRGPDEVFGVAFAVVLALGLLWILVSALFPASAERRCPRCRRPSIVRADAQKLTGLRCEACSWRDDSASAFIHAEDDGTPFEDIVLRERGKPRRF